MNTTPFNIVCLCLFNILFSCQPNLTETTTTGQESIAIDLVTDSLLNLGFEKSDSCSYIPRSISDTLLLGYTPRIKGIYHLKELKLKSIRIKSLKFKRKKDIWTPPLFVYAFPIKDQHEKDNFKNFKSRVYINTTKKENFTILKCNIWVHVKY